MIRRSSVVDLLVRKVMTCFSSCWLTVALVDWHLCCFQQKPGQKRSFYLHLVLRPLLYLSSKVAEAVVRRCWICWKQNKPLDTIGSRNSGRRSREGARSRLIETKGAIWRKAKRAEIAKQNPWWEPNNLVLNQCSVQKSNFSYKSKGLGSECEARTP